MCNTKIGDSKGLVIDVIAESKSGNRLLPARTPAQGRPQHAGESHVSVCRPPRAACESASGAGSAKTASLGAKGRKRKCVSASCTAGRAAIDKQLAGRVDFGVKAAATAAAAAAAVRGQEEEQEEVEGLPGAAATLRRRWLVISIALQRALSHSLLHAGATSIVTGRGATTVCKTRLESIPCCMPDGVSLSLWIKRAFELPPAFQPLCAPGRANLISRRIGHHACTACRMQTPNLCTLAWFKALCWYVQEGG